MCVLLINEIIPCAFFISCYPVLTLMNFLGSAFGVKMCLNRCLSSYGQQLMIGLLTIDNLVKRGRSLVNRCCLYCCDGESVDYLLLHYKFYHTLWCKAFAVFRIQWVMPRSVSFFFFTWRNWFEKHLTTIWNMVSECLIWLVWQERNTRTFEDKERTLDHLKSLIFGTLFHWARIWQCMNCISLSEFLDSISFSS